MKEHATLIEEVDNLLAEAHQVSKTDLAQGVRLTEKALFKTQKIKEKQTLHVNALNQLAVLQRKQKEFVTSKSLAFRSLSLAETLGYSKGIADAQYNISTIAIAENKLSDALSPMLEAAHHYEKIGDFRFLSKSLCLLGNIYEEFQDFKNAYRSYEKAYQLASAGENNILLSDVLLSFASINLKSNKVAKASTQVEQSIALKTQLEQTQKLGKAYYLSGKIQIRLKNREKAERQFIKARELFAAAKDAEGVVDSMQKLGELFFQDHKIKEATNMLEEALEIANQMDLKQSLSKCHQLLFQCFKPANTSKALYHLEEHVRLKEEHDEKYLQNLVDGYGVISKIEDLEKDAQIEQQKASIIEKKNTELDSFFYRVSHDLKGPIASLLGLSDLVEKDIKDPEAKHFFKMYDHQIRRLNAIVMELINITELNYREIKLTPINFYEIVDNCITAYKYLPNCSRINFLIDIQSNVKYNSEWYIVNTILQNLIENSIKYIDITKAKPQIRVRIAKQKENIIFEVSDNGKGIGETHKGKIFDMFYRASEDTSGTGLGLFILKRAVERLRGEVSFQSELGQGSTFKVVLPANKELR